MLHSYGDEATANEATSLKGELLEINPECRIIAVAGDIAEQETSLNLVTEGVEAFGRIGAYNSSIHLLLF